MASTEKRTSLWESGLIWFGAALSLAEMQTGTYFAPLGLGQGLAAILLGHVIGLLAALAWGETNIAVIMLKSGLGIAGLLIILFSTVTTTFLDAYSAGVSSQSLFPQAKGKIVAMAVTVLGTAGAIFLPLLDFTEFLYFIGSVFAPMIAVQLTDYFVIGRRYEQEAFCGHNLLLWLAGFAIYRLLMMTDLPVGSTLPAMLITMLLCLAVNALRSKESPKEAEVH